MILCSFHISSDLYIQLNQYNQPVRYSGIFNLKREAISSIDEKMVPHLTELAGKKF